MTSLFMGQLTNGVPADEKVVRNTATPVDHDAPAAMQNDMPEMSEVETDPNPALGMTNRQKASKWISRLHFRPAWVEGVSNGYQHNMLIDQQVSSSGFAASREAAGDWGHGTMPAAIGIEPVGDLRDGGKMGNDYFLTNDMPVQGTADNTMMSTDQDPQHLMSGSVSAAGKVAARKAAVAGQYAAYGDWLAGK
jgi:hypothetical protein